MTDDRLLILAYGNPLRSDDGAGWYVATRLAEEVDDPAVRIIMHHQLVPEFAESVSRAQAVILIDAAESPDSPPGLINCATVTPAAKTDRPMTHHMTPENLLAWSRDLYGRAPETTLYTIVGGDFSHSENLSPDVRAACDSLVERILAAVRSHA